MSYAEYVVCTYRQSFWAKPLRPAKPQHTGEITGYLCRSCANDLWRNTTENLLTPKHNRNSSFLAKHESMLLYCCQPSVHTHTHKSLRIQQYYVHTDSTGPLIISNPVLLLTPHSSHVFLAQSWLCSLCIYLSVVQRLHAVEIKSEGQRDSGGMSALLNSAGIHACTYPTGEHQQDHTKLKAVFWIHQNAKSNPFIKDMKSAGILFVLEITNAVTQPSCIV